MSWPDLEADNSSVFNYENGIRGAYSHAFCFPQYHGAYTHRHFTSLLLSPKELRTSTSQRSTMEGFLSSYAWSLEQCIPFSFYMNIVPAKSVSASLLTGNSHWSLEPGFPSNSLLSIPTQSLLLVSFQDLIWKRSATTM